MEGLALSGAAKRSNGLNVQMCVLSAIGICFVLLGHISNGSVGIGTFYQLFPYYSFHLTLFLFVSGYFHREEREAQPLRYLQKKAASLLLPYYLINGAFYLFQTALRPLGYTFGRPFRLIEWLIGPWTQLQPAALSIPTWYLFALFLAECMWLALRLAARAVIRREAAREWTLLLLTLALGMICITLANAKPRAEAALVYLRSVVMLPFLQAGMLYRKKLEAHDSLPSLPYFLLVFAAQYVMIFLFREHLKPGLWGLVDFDRSGIGFYLLGLNGIALYLRLSRLIAQPAANSRLILSIGQHTRQIMSYHLFGYFCLNTMLFILHRLGRFGMLIGSFDEELYFSRIYYTCTADTRMIPLYLAAGLAVSLLAARIGRILNGLIRKRENN